MMMSLVLCFNKQNAFGFKDLSLWYSTEPFSIYLQQFSENIVEKSNVDHSLMEQRRLISLTLLQHLYTSHRCSQLDYIFSLKGFRSVGGTGLLFLSEVSED